MTTIGVDPHFEIATAAGGNLVFDSAGDIALEAGGNDITMDAELTLTYATAPQVLIHHTSATTAMQISVADDGAVLLASAGNDADFEIASGTAGSITLDSAEDIFLEAAGADITADAQLTITYAGASQIMLQNNSATNAMQVMVGIDGTTTVRTQGSVAGYEIETLGTGDITLDSSGDIVFQAGGGDVTSDSQLTITLAGNDQLVVAYTATSALTADVDIDGSTTLTTTGNLAHFEIATAALGMITLDSASTVAIESVNGRLTSDARYISTVAAGNPVFEFNVTTDNPVANWTASTAGTFVVSASPNGWLEVFITGSQSLYIPCWL